MPSKYNDESGPRKIRPNEEQIDANQACNDQIDRWYDRIAKCPVRPFGIGHLLSEKEYS